MMTKICPLLDPVQHLIRYLVTLAVFQQFKWEMRCAGCTFDLKGSGKPPWGMPMCPCRNSTTERGKDNSSALSSTSARVREFCTMNCARSPTILEEGVTWRKGKRGEGQISEKGKTCLLRPPSLHLSSLPGLSALRPSGQSELGIKEETECRGKQKHGLGRR